MLDSTDLEKMPFISFFIFIFPMSSRVNTLQLEIVCAFYLNIYRITVFLWSWLFLYRELILQSFIILHHINFKLKSVNQVKFYCISQLFHLFITSLLASCLLFFFLLLFYLFFFHFLFYFLYSLLQIEFHTCQGNAQPLKFAPLLVTSP